MGLFSEKSDRLLLKDEVVCFVHIQTHQVALNQPIFLSCNSQERPFTHALKLILGSCLPLRPKYMHRLWPQPFLFLFLIDSYCLYHMQICTKIHEDLILIPSFKNNETNLRKKKKKKWYVFLFRILMYEQSECIFYIRLSTFFKFLASSPPAAVLVSLFLLPLLFVVFHENDQDPYEDGNEICNRNKQITCLSNTPYFPPREIKKKKIRELRCAMVMVALICA